MRRLLNFRAIWIFYAPILRLNKCQIWQQDFDYIQCKQAFDTVTKISVNNRQNSTQQNAVKLKTRQQRVKATVKLLTTSQKYNFKVKCYNTNIKRMFTYTGDSLRSLTTNIRAPPSTPITTKCTPHSSRTAITLHSGRASMQLTKKQVAMS